MEKMYFVLTNQNENRRLLQLNPQAQMLPNTEESNTHPQLPGISMEVCESIALVQNNNLVSAVPVSIQQFQGGHTATIIVSQAIPTLISTNIPIPQLTPESIGMTEENYLLDPVDNEESTTESDNKEITEESTTLLTVLAPDGSKRQVEFHHPIEKLNVPNIIIQVCKHEGIDDESLVGFMEEENHEDRQERRHQIKDIWEEEGLDELDPDADYADLEENDKMEDGSVSTDNENSVEIENGTELLCRFCGNFSKTLNRCQHCRRLNPHLSAMGYNCKTEVIKIHYEKETPHRRRRCPRKKKKAEKLQADEPVCLTISSDEDEEEESNHPESTSLSNGKDDEERVGSSVREKEPVITESTKSLYDSRIDGGGVDLTELLDTPELEKALLQCRTVRIGSYKVFPEEKVTLSEYGIKIKVPTLNGETTVLKILRTDIVKVLVHFGKAMPVLFYYTTNSAGIKVRNALQMPHKPDNIYFDPQSSAAEMHRRITLLPDKIPEDTRLFIKSIYDNQCLLDELTSKEANDILVRAAPKDIKENRRDSCSRKFVPDIGNPRASTKSFVERSGKKSEGSMIAIKENRRDSCSRKFAPDIGNLRASTKSFVERSGKKSEGSMIAVQTHLRKESSTFQGSGSSQITQAPKIQTIMVYPPPPTKGGISINTEDYACLAEDQFLNDVIIDFYLKWLVLTKLSPEDQKRTHVFSSFFYKRLTTKAPPSGGGIKYQDDPKLTAAEKRHARVKGWTKSVDLFSKDFIVIPINENSHWFLGIICFPGLTGAVRMSDNTPVNNPSRRKISSGFGGPIPSMIGATTITMVQNEPTITLEGEDEEQRDEADADDDDLEPNTSDEESIDQDSGELLDEATPRLTKPGAKIEVEEPIKQPCILIFDSLAGASRAKVCATLREYLQVEYSLKHRGRKRDFSKDTIRGAVPKVPQQDNYTDCGLYVLQYVETFFEKPITNYKMPIKQLKTWFTTSLVSRKRYEIQQLLHKLMEEQNVDIDRLNLPHLGLHPEGTAYSDEGDDHMDDEMGMEEGELDENELAMDEGDLEEEDEQLDDEEEEEEEDEEEGLMSRELMKRETIREIIVDSAKEEKFEFRVPPTDQKRALSKLDEITISNTTTLKRKLPPTPPPTAPATPTTLKDIRNPRLIRQVTPSPSPDSNKKMRQDQ